MSARGDRRGGRAGRCGDVHRSADGSDATRWVTGRRRGSSETRVPSEVDRRGLPGGKVKTSTRKSFDRFDAQNIQCMTYQSGKFT